MRACHLDPHESAGATSCVTRRWTQDSDLIISHSANQFPPPPASLLWFSVVVTTLSQLFLPHSLYSFSQHNTSLHNKACLTASYTIYISSACVLIHLASQNNIGPSTLSLCRQHSRFSNICSPPAAAAVTQDHTGIFALFMTVALKRLVPITIEMSTKTVAGQNQFWLK